MRRLLFWYLPITTSLAAAAIFGWGFVSYLRGDTGEPVDVGAMRVLTPSAAATAPAQWTTVMPIILGDSLARGAGDQQGLGIAGRLDQELRRRGVQARRTYNLGVNGARTADLLRQLESPNVQQMLRESNVIVISIGGNDLWGGADWRSAPPPDPEKAMSDVLGRIERIVERVREVNPDARIFFVGLYSPMGRVLAPYVARWNARMLEEFGGDPNFTLVQTADLFSHRDRLALDRFHPSGDGYGLIARRIADAL